MEKELLSEEKYQKNNKKVGKTGKILLGVGIAILLVGVVLLIMGFTGFGSTMTSVNTDSAPNALVGNAFGSIGMFAIGGFAITTGIFITAIGGTMLMLSHRRGITAYGVQQTMPVAQEGIEKMTPTISKAAGEVAKSIKTGVDEAKKQSEKEK